MDIQDTKKVFTEQAQIRKSEGYSLDCADMSFKRHVLILLEKLVESQKEFGKQIKYMWQTLDEMKSIDKGEKK